MPGEHKKHTPIVSEKQRGLFGAEYARRKAGEEPRMPGITKAELKSHLQESKGKDLPYKVTGNALRDAVMGGSPAVVRAARAKKKKGK